MQIINADSVAQALPYDRLIESLRKAFSTETISPERTQHKIKTNGNYDATLLVMPAWRQGKNVGIKIVSVFPGNVEQNLSAVHAGHSSVWGALLQVHGAHARAGLLLQALEMARRD